MIDETIRKYIKEEGKSDSEVIPDAVQVIYEMERAVVEAKRINYMTEDVEKL
jgi:hypothetical protein